MTIEEAFRLDVPPAVLQELAQGIQQAVTQTEVGLSEWLHYGEEKRNLRPWLRRALIEQMLRGIADLHPDIASAESRLDQSGFWFHVHLKVGRFVITEHALADDDATLRPAGYKEQAAASNQLFLFADFNDIELPDDTTDLYAVLVYGKCPDNSLAFAKIKFPKPDITDGFLHGEIDLMAQFPDIFLDLTHAVPVEQIAEPDAPTIIQSNTGA